MKRSIVSHIRRALRKHAFKRKNHDVQRVYGEGDERLGTDHSSYSASLSPNEVEHWDDFGFIVLKSFFDTSIVDEFKRHIDHLWQSRNELGNPVMIYTDRSGTQLFREALDADRLDNYRLLDQYLIDAPTRGLCMDRRLVAVLHQLMAYEPIVCNSILFEWGSEQDMHSDLFYMPPISQNQMLATWIALDDVTEDNGPLLYVPGSHKLPPHRFSHGEVHAVIDEVPDAVAAMQAQMAAHGLQTEKFLAKRGDVFIWHSQLVHGGDAIRDRSSRRTSLVTHYYSTCDLPQGSLLCAETRDGSLLLIKKHLPCDVAVG